MYITSSFKGVSKLAIMVVAGVSAACGQVQLQGPNETAVEPEVAGHGVLNLTSEQFPEGAESLTLRIKSMAQSDCYYGGPYVGDEHLPASGSGIEQGESKLKRRHCKRLGIVATPVIDSFTNDGLRIFVERGQEITPIRLIEGSYQVTADFFDKSKELIYTGSEWFYIKESEQKSLTIRLKKIASGELTIGFEVEKPIEGPTRLSNSDNVEFEKKILVGRQRYLKKIDLNSELGVAVISTIIYPERPGTTPNKSKFSLSKTQLRAITKVLGSVELSKTDARICVEPLELIRVTVKKCKDCELGKVYNYSNAGCGSPDFGTHNMSGKVFDELWSVITSKNFTN